MRQIIRGIAACLALQLFAAAPLPAAQLAAFRLQVEDLSGNSITSVLLGQDFKLAAYVEDIRDPEVPFPGVWAAFMNVAYNSSLASITPMPNPDPIGGDGHGNFGDLGIEWGSYFAAGLRFGDTGTPGQIQGIGSASLARVQSRTGRTSGMAHDDSHVGARARRHSARRSTPIQITNRLLSILPTRSRTSRFSSLATAFKSCPSRPVSSWLGLVSSAWLSCVGARASWFVELRHCLLSLFLVRSQWYWCGRVPCLEFVKSPECRHDRELRFHQFRLRSGRAL